MAKGEEAHLGFLSGIMVEKDQTSLEMIFNDISSTEFFRGNDAEDQNWDAAMLQEMATAPTTLEASRYSDVLSCFPGNSVEWRDVQQAYLQAEVEGTPTYVVLPPKLWTPELKKMRRPVFRELKAPYGHKNSGADWH